jgi:hypothetical protein
MKSIVYTICLALLTSGTVAAADEVVAPRPPKLEKPGDVTLKRYLAEEQRRKQEESAPAGQNVTVVKGENATVYEYRRDGGLYRTEIDPKYGPVYIFDGRDDEGSVNDGGIGPQSQDTQMWNLMKW